MLTNFHTPRLGIARSSSLSPLLAAFHLYEVDAHFANQQNLDYSRYMDDFFIIAKTRWHLRKAVRQLNQFFAQYGFTQHPDKTFIGPTRKGTDWMGYWLTDQGVQSLAPRALTNHLTKRRRLYEQTRHLTARQQQARVVEYVGRWLRWLSSVFGPRASFCCRSPTLRAHVQVVERWIMARIRHETFYCQTNCSKTGSEFFRCCKMET